jgi:hypothetical protein
MLTARRERSRPAQPTRFVSGISVHPVDNFYAIVGVSDQPESIGSITVQGG